MVGDRRRQDRSLPFCPHSGEADDSRADPRMRECPNRRRIEPTACAGLPTRRPDFAKDRVFAHVVSPVRASVRYSPSATFAMLRWSGARAGRDYITVNVLCVGRATLAVLFPLCLVACESRIKDGVCHFSFAFISTPFSAPLYLFELSPARTDYFTQIADRDVQFSQCLQSFREFRVLCAAFGPPAQDGECIFEAFKDLSVLPWHDGIT